MITVGEKKKKGLGVSETNSADSPVAGSCRKLLACDEGHYRHKRPSRHYKLPQVYGNKGATSTILGPEILRLARAEPFCY